MIGGPLKEYREDDDVDMESDGEVDTFGDPDDDDFMPDPSDMEESDSDIDSDNDDSDSMNYVLNRKCEPLHEKQFLVSETALSELLVRCRECGAPTQTVIQHSRGTMISTASGNIQF